MNEVNKKIGQILKIKGEILSCEVRKNTITGEMWVNVDVMVDLAQANKIHQVLAEYHKEESVPNNAREADNAKD